MRVGLPGRFNVLNALGAWAAARALGVPPATIAGALAGAGRVPGRFEPVDEGQPFAVLVDYSHTPDSLENALRAARELAEHRVIAVFGAGGDRDRGKRPLMGAIAAREADVAIVTSDNPRSEDPDAIIAEILAGIDDRCGRRGRRRPARGDPPRDRARRAGRRARDRRQGPRAGAGVRGRAQGALRRRRGRARGAARGQGARVKHWSDSRVAGAAGAELLRPHPDGRAADGPSRVTIDSREIGPGDLFVGIPGENVDGGSFAAMALAAGAWGVLVTGEWAAEAVVVERGAVLLSQTPTAALGALARAWRRDLARARDRGHRLGRQDLDQGPDHRADRAAPRASRRTRRTSTPRSGCRWRSSARRSGRR